MASAGTQSRCGAATTWTRRRLLAVERGGGVGGSRVSTGATALQCHGLRKASAMVSALVRPAVRPLRTLQSLLSSSSSPSPLAADVEAAEDAYGGGAAGGLRLLRRPLQVAERHGVRSGVPLRTPGRGDGLRGGR